ncbi:MAG: YdeI/OmpD-associated family protein [Pirellulaceae bacterium]|nr:YdeI/OmpD-associated family protein [Pirellulaceae bacterium]
MKKRPTQPTIAPQPVEAPDDKPILAFAKPILLERWLAKHHCEHAGVWIRFFKAGSGHASVTYAEALDVALCYGWIDGPVRKGDDVSWIHKFTPRGKRSVWSQKNKLHIERLTKEGRMQPAGQAAIEAAKADGRWDAAYASSSTFVETPEFMAALKKSKKAAAFYATLSKANRYAIYYRLHTPKKAQTKARKLVELIAMLERGETFH